MGSKRLHHSSFLFHSLGFFCTMFMQFLCFTLLFRFHDRSVALLGWFCFWFQTLLSYLTEPFSFIKFEFLECFASHYPIICTLPFFLVLGALLLSALRICIFVLFHHCCVFAHNLRLYLDCIFLDFFIKKLL